MRKRFYWLLVAMLMVAASQPMSAWANDPTGGAVTVFESVTPESQGVDSAELTALHEKILASGGGKYLSSVLIMRNGKIVSEGYFNGHKPDEKGEMFSVTKSITALLIGIAVDKGDIKSLEDPAGKYLASGHLSSQGGITIRDLLNMRSGLDWPEGSVSYASMKNPSTRMLLSESDSIAFVAGRKQITAPGINFNYSTGDSQLLSGVITGATGMKEAVFAKKYLFDPLSIANVQWAADSKGINYGGFGLALSSRDMAKIGQLCLDKGMYAGHKIVSSDYFTMATSTGAIKVKSTNFTSYGFQWWIMDDGTYVAEGIGGQFILVSPAKNLVCVVRTDIPLNNAFSVSIKNMTLKSFYYDYILPACKSNEPLPANPISLVKLQLLLQGKTVVR